MAFKKRAVGTAATKPPLGESVPAALIGSVPGDDPDAVHMMKQTLTKTGGRPRVEVNCGREGEAYRGKGTGGMRTTIWHRDVTCKDCRSQPSTNLWFQMYPVMDDSATIPSDEE